MRSGGTFRKWIWGFNKPGREVLSHSWDGDESAVPLLWRGEGKKEPTCPALLVVLHLTGTGVRARLAQQNIGEGAAMRTVRIYPLKNRDQRTRARLKAAQMEVARVWMYCVSRHRAARAERTGWPSQDDLQRETKGGTFALHSQSIQMVCQQFLANVQTIKQLRQTNPRHRYPYHPKQYMTVQWPAQAVSRQGNRLILPTARGRKSFAFHLPERPDQIGAVSLVWHGGYELHLVVPASPLSPSFVLSAQPVQASVDLGEIHQAAVTTSTGRGLIVPRRGLHSPHLQHDQTLVHPSH